MVLGRATRLSLIQSTRTSWNEHFTADKTTGTMLGLTAKGCATVDCLRMNRPAQLTARRLLDAARAFPWAMRVRRRRRLHRRESSCGPAADAGASLRSDRKALL
jgi:hypothetical protein